MFYINTASNRDFKYWSFKRLDLFEISDDEYLAEFQLITQGLPKLEHILLLTQEFRCTQYKNFKISFTEALFILLLGLAYLFCSPYMIHKFEKAVPNLFIIFSQF